MPSTFRTLILETYADFFACHLTAGCESQQLSGRTKRGGPGSQLSARYYRLQQSNIQNKALFKNILKSSRAFVLKITKVFPFSRSS